LISSLTVSHVPVHMFVFLLWPYRIIA
jgi:hypothetical protein